MEDRTVAIGPMVFRHWCNIEPQVVDYATLCSEVVLHVDDNQRSLGKIDLNWFRFGVQLDAATLDAFRGRRPISWRGGLSRFAGRASYTADHSASTHKGTAGYRRHRILHG